MPKLPRNDDGYFFQGRGDQSVTGCSRLFACHRIDSPHPLRAAATHSFDEDLQLSLYCCYELHYQGLPGVSDDWEWEPSLLELRGCLEGAFEKRLHSALPDCGSDLFG